MTNVIDFVALALNGKYSLTVVAECLVDGATEKRELAKEQQYRIDQAINLCRLYLTNTPECYKIYAYIVADDSQRLILIVDRDGLFFD